MESVRLTTSDGHELVGDVLAGDATPSGGVVVCHPHPQYGGDRFNPIVDTVFRHLAELGFTTLRFDFRSDFGEGVAEREDVVAAIDELHRRGVDPIHVVGYSFGAAVALSTTDERIVRIVAVAPPLAVMTTEPPAPRTLVLTAQFDQFTTPDQAGPIVDRWPNASMRIIEGSDHFLVGRSTWVAETAGDWLTPADGGSAAASKEPMVD